jgi:hypothetical protein
VKRLREHDEVERPAGRLPILERRLLDMDPLPGGHACHPRVWLHGEDICTGLYQLGRGDARPGSHVQDPSIVCDQPGDECRGVARTVAVVLLRG